MNDWGAYRFFVCIFLTCWVGACGSSPTGTLPPATQGAQDPTVALLRQVAPELKESAKNLPYSALDGHSLPTLRQAFDPEKFPLPENVRTMVVSLDESSPPVTLFVADLRPTQNGKPVYLHLHGGGFVAGTAASTASLLPVYANACDCVVISVDYRLAPETPFPGPLNDAVTALKWVRANAELLGVDINRIAVGGESAGGGLAAQLAIAARDLNIPIVFQVLIYPMLDDRTGRDETGIIQENRYVWTAASNQFAWSAYLGQPAGQKDAPYGAVPARVENLNGLAPAWIGVGSVDLFANESMVYAMRLERSGVPVDLIMVPGGYHGFDVLAPQTEPALMFTAAWRAALHSALHGPK